MDHPKSFSLRSRVFAAVLVSVLALQTAATGYAGGFERLAPGLQIQGMDQLSTQLGQLNQTLGSTNGTLSLVQGNWTTSNGVASDIVNQWQTTNGLIQQFLNPGSAVWQGIAVGAGFATGSILIKLAGEAISAAGSAAYEAVTHKKRNAKTLAYFIQAKENYEKVSDTLSEIERRVETFILLSSEVRRVGGKEQLIRSLSANISQSQAFSKLAQKMLSQVSKSLTSGAEIDQTMLKDFLNKKVELDYELQKAVDLKATLESTFSQSSCAQTQNDLEHLIQAESLLQHARVPLLSPTSQRIWLENWNEQYIEDLSYTENTQNKAEIELLYQSYADAAQRRFEAQIEADPFLQSRMNDAWYQCMGDRSCTGHIPVVGHLFHRTDRAECHEEIRRPDSQYARDHGYSELLRPLVEARDQRLASSEFRRSSDILRQPVRMDPRVMTDQLDSFDRFFDQLRLEQNPENLSQRIAGLKEKRLRVQELCSENLMLTSD